jgi:outer membrane murein-binding lipoprotein Lpp
MTKTQKKKLKETGIQYAIAIAIFVSLLSLGGCISTTAHVDPTPAQRLKAEQAQVVELRAQVEELQTQNEYLRRIAIATEKIAKNGEQ